MKTSKFLAPVLLALATAATSSAFAFNDNTYPELPASTGTVTRAQVQADLAQAAKDGTLQVSDASYPVLPASTSQKTRAQVVSELKAAHGDYPSHMYSN